MTLVPQVRIPVVVDFSIRLFVCLAAVGLLLAQCQVRLELKHNLTMWVTYTPPRSEQETLSVVIMKLKHSVLVDKIGESTY